MFTSSPGHAVKLAKRARSVDPFLVEPFWALALAAEERGQLPSAFAYYAQATRRQPENPQTWLLAGQFALRNGCPRAAYSFLLQFVERDNKARPTDGADDYRHALDLVDSGKPKC